MARHSGRSSPDDGQGMESKGTVKAGAKRRRVQAECSADYLQIDLSAYSLPPLPPLPAVNRAQSPSQTSPRSSSPRFPTDEPAEETFEPPQFARINDMPPIWCMTRQELCESLPYFRSYQGGHYDRDGLCWGYLLDRFPSALDACSENGRVIISHAGGSSEISNGSYRLKADQDKSSGRVSALVRCFETKSPVALIAGDGWKSMTSYMSKCGARYAVLGLYLCTDHWCEAEPGDDAGSFFVRYKFRFEWIASQGTPWFEDVIEDTVSTSAAQPRTQAVSQSKESNRSIAGHFNLRTPCSQAGRDPLVQAAIDSGFRVFQAQKAKADFRRTLHDPTPHEILLAAINQIDSARQTLSRMAADISTSTSSRSIIDQTSTSRTSTTIGQVQCPRCGESSNDRFSESIACFNPGCSNFFSINDEIKQASDSAYSDSFLSLWGADAEQVPFTLVPRELSGICCTVYSMQDWRGFYCSNCGRLSSRIEWSKLQCSNAKCAKSVDLFLPAVVVKRGADFRPRTIPGQCLPFESDGWKGYTKVLDIESGARIHHLWPDDASGSDELFRAFQAADVASLLRRNPLRTARFDNGGTLCSQFTFNAGAQYNHAIKAKTVTFEQSPKAVLQARALMESVTSLIAPQTYEGAPFNEILCVGYMAECKMNFHDDGERGLGPLVATVSLGANAKMTFRRKKPRTRAGEPKLERADPLVHLDLRHGDITIMEGHSLQAMFEHKVVPDGLRFAATARHISEEHHQVFKKTKVPRTRV